MSGTPKRMVDIETPCRRGRDAPPPSRSPPAHPTTTATTNISTQCSPRPTARRTTTHRVHLEPDKQHHDETTPSGGGSTSSGAQHTPDDQCDTKCFFRAETIHTDSQVHVSSCLFLSCSQFSRFVLNLYSTLSICFRFVTNSFTLCLILSICSRFSQFVLNFVNSFSIHSIAVNLLSSQVVLIVSCHSHATEHRPFKLFLVLVSF
jgi:hypothetical protein